MRKKGIYGIIAATAFGIILTIQPVNVVKVEASTTTASYTAEEQKLLSLIESKRKEHGGNNSVQIGSTSYNWEYFLTMPNRMKEILAEAKTAGSFIIFKSSGYITYNTNGGVVFDSSIATNTANSSYTAEEKKLLDLIESKRKANGSSNSVQVGSTSYNWEYFLTEPTKMKQVLAEAKATGSFIIFTSNGSITFKTDGSSDTPTPPTPQKTTFTEEEKALIKLIEYKRLENKGSNSVQIGTTSYNWEYFLNEQPDKLKDILAEAKAAGSFLIFTSNGSIEFKTSGDVVLPVITTTPTTGTPPISPTEQKEKPAVSSNTDLEKKVAELEALTKELQQMNKQLSTGDTSKINALEDQLKALLATQQVGASADASFLAKINEIQKELEALKTKTDKNSKDIEKNKQDIQENRSMIEKLADAINNLIETLGTFISVLKGVLGL